MYIFILNSGFEPETLEVFFRLYILKLFCIKKRCICDEFFYIYFQYYTKASSNNFQCMLNTSSFNENPLNDIYVKFSPDFHLKCTGISNMINGVIFLFHGINRNISTKCILASGGKCALKI